MNESVKKVLKYMRNILIVLSSTSVILIIISTAGKFGLPRIFVCAGAIYMLMGALSVVGKNQLISNTGYFQARSISSRSVYDNFSEDFNSKEGNYSFLVFMAIAGFLLIMIGFILGGGNF